MQKPARLVVAALSLVSLGFAFAMAAETLSGRELARALQNGGYVIVMRHASSPREVPDAAGAAAGNQARERQLDQNGINTATAMGSSLRGLKIAIGDVWSSPTFRARQTVNYAGLPAPTLAAELGDGGQSMSATSASQASWLRAKAAQPPRKGTNTLVVTHFPNIRSAFEDASSGLADGEALILRPDGSNSTKVVGRIRIEDWPTFLK